jgi:hypothetical protein
VLLDVLLSLIGDRIACRYGNCRLALLDKNDFAAVDQIASRRVDTLVGREIIRRIEEIVAREIVPLAGHNRRRLVYAIRREGPEDGKFVLLDILRSGLVLEFLKGQKRKE